MLNKAFFRGFKWWSVKLSIPIALVVLHFLLIHFFQTNLTKVDINIPSIVGFYVSAFISFNFIDTPIQKLHDRILVKKNVLLKDCFGGSKKIEATSTTKSNAEIRKQFQREHLLSLSKGLEIGQLERLFYIYAVMNQGGFDLIAGIIVLKAFFGWMDTGKIRRSIDASGTAGESEDSEDVLLYYAYIYGNLLSLASGILLGHTATFIAKVVWLI
jgi:hypothetical protein